MKLGKRGFEEGILTWLVIGILIIVILSNLYYKGSDIADFCGNGICDNGESGFCHIDCDWCGDGYCQKGEGCLNCPEDCSCGVKFNLEDKKCEDILGENCKNSEEDCKCSEGKKCIYGKCIGFCGDRICDYNEEKVCKADCDWCGDGYCQEEENCSTCSKDCGDCNKEHCGDGYCQTIDCASGCWIDCSYSDCSNGICESEIGENCINSPIDCRCVGGFCNSENKLCVYFSCGNLICDENDDYLNCPNDCSRNYSSDNLSDVNYPVLFVHGHTIIEKESISYSIDDFKEYQEKLDEEGYYLDKGIVLLSTKKSDLSGGVWAKLDKPISLRMSYYYGAYDKFGSYIGPEDNQKISVYGDRLSEIVDKVLYFSGKNKIDIVAHSMGGLVTRDYIENKGGMNRVNKLILIATPNNGTEGYIKTYCGNLHPGPECVDMKKGSEFLRDLNKDRITEGVLYYSLIGLGDYFYMSCPEGDKDDGVICESSAYLEGAENLYFNKKGGKEPMHNWMTTPSIYPEIYDEVVNLLRR